VAKSLQDSPGDASEASVEALAVQFGVGVAPWWRDGETETMVGIGIGTHIWDLWDILRPYIGVFEMKGGWVFYG
jgi:hypothetical protein